ncbi:MAG: hypothetical protein SFW09_05800 [Hyphomicrobiaceae bacterium]|nr:hypothetical protein [Hyphomicrobiaceae bacterium]
MTATYAVVWPRSARSVEVKALAPRLPTLEGRTIAFLWDYLFRGDEIWPVLSAELGRRFPGMRFIGWEEFGSTHGDEEHKVLAELPGKLKSLKVDAVVSGMGC